MTDKIEENVKRLITLSKEKLSGDEAKEVREIMVYLRKKGMTSREIEELTDGRWKESTIRGYVKGVKPRDEWKSEASMLRELVSADLTVEDVKQAIELFQQIDVEEVIDAVSQLKSEGLSLEDLITSYQGLRDQKLTPTDVDRRDA